MLCECQVTQHGQPVCGFDDTCSTKRPYEVLLIGRATMHGDDSDRCDVVPSKQLPDHRVVVSVPCSIHSRKPPLASEGFRSLLVEDDSDCLSHFVKTLTTVFSSTSAD